MARRWIVLLLLASAACKEKGAPAPAGETAPPAAAGGAVIGAALSLTGGAAAYGASQRAGIMAAVDDLPAPKLDVRVEDDASTKEQGITVFQKLINRDKVSAIIGPTLSNTASAADPLAQQAGVPVLAISNTAATGITDIGDYIWRDSLTEAAVIPARSRRRRQSSASRPPACSTATTTSSPRPATT